MIGRPVGGRRRGGSNAGTGPSRTLGGWMADGQDRETLDQLPAMIRIMAESSYGATRVTPVRNTRAKEIAWRSLLFRPGVHL